jgi:hypothetical protein
VNFKVLADLFEGMELLLQPFVADTHNRVFTVITFKDFNKFRKTALVADRHAVNLVKNDA